MPLTPFFSFPPLGLSPFQPLVQDPDLDPITNMVTPGQSPEKAVRTADGARLFTYDKDVQGGAGGRPRIGEVVSTVAPVPAPMGVIHRAQWEVGALLTIEMQGRCGPLVLGQSKSVKTGLRATLEGQAVSRQHQEAWLG